MRTVGVALGAATAVGAVGVLARAAREIPAAFGGDPTKGVSGALLSGSPRYRDGVFHNDVEPESGPQSGPEGGAGTVLREMLFGKQLRRPSKPIPLVRDVSADAPASEELAVTWFGHSTALVEIEGTRLLLDPVWSKRCSPSQSAGPRRIHEPPVALDELPPIDAVVISHDHYDHLDMHSIVDLSHNQDARFLVPLGVGAHLERWGVSRDRIDELDWEGSVEIRGIRLVATSAQHFSGRRFSNNGTLWASWAILGARHRVFYSGDSGYFDGFAETGDRYGPFDLSLVQIGAYSDHWRSIHMTPEEGVSTHLDVNRRRAGLAAGTGTDGAVGEVHDVHDGQGGDEGDGDGRDARGEGLFVPVHWGTFVLGLHDWSEPVERLCLDADARGVRVAVPRPGERIEVSRPPKLDHWWRSVV
ncbi:MBL fold metallo-hydrolase [Streptacidiphilus sp. EB129]|uniref:MBL fold metallo-hydrolase n=1 Tax=Streptacidiphilus sp. EB129 TaxID=3156262 RepID=UPI0035120038